jgi:hypothetical protein
MTDGFGYLPGSGAITPPRELLEFLYRYDPRVQSLALGLRKVIHEEMAPCHEYIFQMRSKVVLLYGSTAKVIADGICSISVFARHVTLAFTHGKNLDDPAGLLEGAGKGMRHIRLNKLSDLDRREIRTFLRQARKLAGMARRRTGAVVTTRVKRSSAPSASRPGSPAAGLKGVD